MSKQTICIPQKDLREWQLIQLDMLKEIDRICKKHNIKYCIIAGTVLGAVRHKGYIPWDDDADVAMLRPEYERFCKICEEELNSDKYFFQTHSNTHGYRWGYGKIRRKGTEFIRQGQEHMPYETGVFVDVFPLDNVPDNIIARRLHNATCFVIRKMLWSAVGSKADSNFIKRGIYSFLSIIPKVTVFKMYDLLKNISNRKGTKLVRILTFPTPNNGYYGYFREWYEELTDLEFEGYFFPGPRNFDKYLTFKFGNYLELPPTEKRKGHAISSYRLLTIEDKADSFEAS